MGISKREGDLLREEKRDAPGRGCIPLLFLSYQKRFTTNRLHQGVISHWWTPRYTRIRLVAKLPPPYSNG